MDFSGSIHLIRLALEEDLGERGDVTSSAVFKDEQGSLSLVCKGAGVLAGRDLFDLVHRTVDPGISVEWLYSDGDVLEANTLVATVTGRTSSLLSAERTALNFLSFLSGIATLTRRYVERARAGGNAVVLDTRKTLPAYRELSKYAVRKGGGTNHRMGLYDMVMLKDNHVDLCGSISEAVARVRSKWGDEFCIEVECRTEADVDAAIAAGADMIMLDNMDTGTIARIAARPRAEIKLEASGNVDLSSIETLASTGVDFISVGKLTHSAPALDFSLRRTLERKGG